MRCVVEVTGPAKVAKKDPWRIYRPLRIVVLTGGRQVSCDFVVGVMGPC